MSKRILCYGDSNTWGYDPRRSAGSPYYIRLAYEERWPGILQNELGGGYRVIEEGLNGRTTMWDDPAAPYRNGLKHIDVCLETHTPIDLVILMLGTNDMKPRISGRAYDSALGAECLVKRIRQMPCGRHGKTPEILVVSPVAIGKDIGELDFAGEFGGVNAHTESLELPRYLREMADANGCAFLDAAQYAQVVIDAIHMDEENNARLGGALAQCVKKILP